MTRLDQHVAAVQNRLALASFLDALAKTMLAGAAIVLLGVGVDKGFGFSPPGPVYWVGGLASTAALAALFLAWRRRPDRFFAAAAIDQKLDLHEKISTALFARRSDDPFSIAAVRDAEHAAGDVVLNLRTRFPLTFPKLAYVSIAACGLAYILATFLPPLDHSTHDQASQKKAITQQAADHSKKQLEDALAQVNAAPPSIANDEKIKLAKQDLIAQLGKPGSDPAQSACSALKALQDVQAAAEQQIKSNVQFAQAKADEKMWKQMGEQPITEAGPVNDIRRELSDGKTSQALDDLSKVVDNFDKMNKEDQKKAADQMQQLAQQLKQMGNPTPQQQQQAQQQMQRLGLTPQQAQQAQQLTQQAANGNPQAQQQLQQMAKQAMSQMNNGQGPTPQQKQQLQQMMQQMQAGANNQAQAQQLAQAAQQMAKAMQQQSGQQSAQQKQSAGQQTASKSGGQSGQQQQAQAGQQAQQQGRQGQQGQGQQAQAQQAGGQQSGMSGAMQQMQQQLQQMQATAADAQQIAAAQQNAQQAMNGDQPANSPNGGQPGQQGQPGQWPGNNGDGNQPGQGKGPGNNGQGGHGFGSRGEKMNAPYTVKQEISPSPDNPDGRLLATTFVKAGSIKGESKEQLKAVAASAMKDATDEVEQDRISRQAQGIVRKYFSSMEEDSTTPSPATQP